MILAGYPVDVEDATASYIRSIVSPMKEVEPTTKTDGLSDVERALAKYRGSDAPRKL
jgi:hypothetical protein